MDQLKLTYFDMDGGRAEPARLPEGRRHAVLVLFPAARRQRPARPGPARPGWGGQYRREADGWYVDLDPADGVDPRDTVSRWRPDFQADFARRMNWGRPSP